MEEIKKKRAATKGWLKRDIKCIESLLKKENVSEIEILSALKEFDKRRDKLATIQSELEPLLEPQELEADIEQEYDFYSLCQNIKVDAEVFLTKNIEEVVPQSVRSSHFDEGRAQLPKIQMDKFSGEHTEWTSFIDKFHALIGNSDISAVAKFSYLQSLLLGDASACIEGLSLTADNYKHALKILEDRYGRKEKIIFCHIQKLLGVHVGNSRNAQHLWTIHNQLQSHIRSLENLGISKTQYGVILTPLILSRLPAELRLEWARDSDQRESDLDFLMEFLHREIVRRERSQDFSVPLVSEKGQTVHSDRNTDRNVIRKGQNETRKYGTASALLSKESNENKDIPKCVFCDKKHYLSKCSEISKMDPEVVRCKLRENRLCYVCFRPYSYHHHCKVKCSYCHGKHNYIFCKQKRETQSYSDSNPNTNAASESNPNTNAMFYAKSEFTGRQTMMQTCEVTLGGKNAVFLFDSAADKSYISSSFVNAIRPKFIGKEETSFCGFGNEVPTERKTRNVYELGVKGESGVNVNLCLTEIDTICKTMYRPQVPAQFLSFFHSHALNLGGGNKKGKVKVDILIGLDYYWKLIQPGKVVSSPDGLVAQETIFGKWVLSGSWPSLNPISLQVSHQYLVLDSVTDETVRRFWDVESIGIVDNNKNWSTENVILTEFEKTISFSNQMYEVQLPWKEEMKGKLMNNFEAAVVRAKKLDAKLSKNTELRSDYQAVFQCLGEEGIISEVPEEERETKMESSYYLPHFPVVKKESLTTKVRPVFDASCPGPNGVSLNQCVEPGPNLLNNLVEILLRFRRWPVALTTDIRKAFLSIRLKRSDQDVQRFILVEGEKLRIMRCERVIFGCASSPFLLCATLKFHLNKYKDCDVAHEVQDNIYMDDILTGCDRVTEACEMVEKVTKIMNEGGMRLSKWASNSAVVKEKLSKDFNDANVQGEVVKVLGLTWDSSGDHFGFKGCNIPTEVVVTKRLVLSMLARIFDPLGFLTPFTMEAKVIFQELWIAGLDWDEEVTGNLKTRFNQWICGLSLLQQWAVPRCYVTDSWSKRKSLELLCFCDASEKGYCAVVYLRVIEKDNSQSTSLVISKARVAPVKRMTLPRLELLGCLLGARLVNFVRKALFLPEDTPYRCWTDSMVALQWVRSDPFKWKMFVANRVSEIHQLTCPSKWRHCPGIHNPADLGTRGISAKDLMNNDVWLKGPTDPLLGETNEDNEVDSVPVSMVCASEQKPQENQIIESNQSIVSFPVERWGGFTKAIRVISWILRFLHNCRHKKDDKIVSKELSVEELEGGKVAILKNVQSVHYSEEKTQLRKGKVIHKSSPLHRLNPFLANDGLMRLTGRLQFSDQSFESRHPIILPKCHVSKLIISRVHLTMKHAGVPHMLTSVRQNFWIVGARSLARKVKRECVKCARFDALPCQQPMAPLPKERVNRAEPFSVTGIDFAGPVYTADFLGKKFFVCLFTCGTIRAIHLELVDNLSTDQFMLAFKRFVSRRRLPTCIFSDNAKTFKAAVQQTVKEFGENSPKWKFITPRSPWVGGMWERMVRSVKSSMKKCVGVKSLTKTELITLLCEIEDCINSRPLTFVGDTLDSLEPLTPNHFLGGGNAGRGTSDPSLGSVNKTDLRQLATAHTQEIECFWRVWSQSYIKSLPHAPVTKYKGNLSVGDLVVIREDNCPRLYWPLGKITKLIPGKDTIVRTVEVKTKKGLCLRPTQRIHCLEFDTEDIEDVKSPVFGSQINEATECNSNDSMTAKCNTSKCEQNSNVQTVTRAGRIVKPRNVLNV